MSKTKIWVPSPKKQPKHLQQGIREPIQTIPVDPQTVEKLSVCQFQNQHQFSQVLSKILISHSHTIQATKASVSKGWRIELLSTAHIIQITGRGHSGHHCFGFGVDALELIMQCKANAQQSRNEYRLPAHWRTAHIVASAPQWTHHWLRRQNWQKFTNFLAACNFYRLACTAANKYLNAIINKCERVGKRLNSWREPSVSGPGADFWGLIVGGGGWNDNWRQLMERRGSGRCLKWCIGAVGRDRDAFQ